MAYEQSLSVQIQRERTHVSPIITIDRNARVLSTEDEGICQYSRDEQQHSSRVLQHDEALCTHVSDLGA